MSRADGRRLLIVGQHYWPETFRISDIAEGFVERGYKVDVLCGKPNYPSGKFFAGYGFFRNRREVRGGVRIIRVPEIPRGGNSNFRIFVNYVSFPFFAMFYVPYFLTQKYDRILAYQLSPVFMSFPAILISKAKHIPLYFYICDFWPHSLLSMINIRRKWLVSLITRVSYWHYRRADGAIGVFKGMQERLVSEVGLPREKTLYIPQAPEKIYERVVRDEVLEERFPNGFRIVFAGNINPAQSFDVITQAAKIVHDSGYEDVKYIILGEGMSKKWLIEEVARLGLSNSFYFEGFQAVESVPKYQTVADALIVALSRSPLFEYGIPAKIYSYLPSGKPIIAAIDGEGGRLINRLANCGRCVESGDTEGLANAIIELYRMTPGDRSRLGANGKKYYLEHFEREYNLTRLEEFVFNNRRVVDEEYADE